MSSKLLQKKSVIKCVNTQKENLPYSITYIKNGTKLTLLVENESQAKHLYNSMGIRHREVLRVAWGQASPRRIDGVFPHEDLPQNNPHFVQSVEENGIPVFRQL
jgi:hypothetical protein